MKILKDAFDAGKKFRVIVVDSRPKNEGNSRFALWTWYGPDMVLYNDNDKLFRPVGPPWVRGLPMVAGSNIYWNLPGVTEIVLFDEHDYFQAAKRLSHKLKILTKLSSGPALIVTLLVFLDSLKSSKVNERITFT